MISHANFAWELLLLVTMCSAHLLWLVVFSETDNIVARRQSELRWRKGKRKINMKELHCKFKSTLRDFPSLDPPCGYQGRCRGIWRGGRNWQTWSNTWACLVTVKNWAQSDTLGGHFWLLAHRRACLQKLGKILPVAHQAWFHWSLHNAPIHKPKGFQSVMSNWKLCIMYTCTYSKLASKLNVPKILLSTCLLFALRFTHKIQWFSCSSSIFIFPHFLFPISLPHFHFLFPFSFPFLFSLSHPFLSLLTSHSVSWWLLPQGLCTHVHVASLYRYLTKEEAENGF